MVMQNMPLRFLSLKTAKARRGEGEKEGEDRGKKKKKAELKSSNREHISQVLKCSAHNCT